MSSHVIEVDLAHALPELEKRENARWLALLIDTEGAMGWIRFTWTGDRVDREWRYTYHYAEPHIIIAMSERESKETVDEAARLMATKPVTVTDRRDTYIVIVRSAKVTGAKALTVITYCSPYFVKGRRMGKLLKTLFKYRVNPRREEFEKAITELFGKYMKAEEANDKFFDMTERQFEALIERAETVAGRYLT